MSSPLNHITSTLALALKKKSKKKDSCGDWRQPELRDFPTMKFLCRPSERRFRRSFWKEGMIQGFSAPTLSIVTLCPLLLGIFPVSPSVFLTYVFP